MVDKPIIPSSKDITQYDLVVSTMVVSPPHSVNLRNDIHTALHSQSSKS